MPQTEIRFRAKHHPAANGRQPQAGDALYICSFPLEDGRVLVIEMGQQDFDTSTNLLMDMLTKAPSHTDEPDKA